MRQRHLLPQAVLGVNNLEEVDTEGEQLRGAPLHGRNDSDNLDVSDLTGGSPMVRVTSCCVAAWVLFCLLACGGGQGGTAATPQSLEDAIGRKVTVRVALSDAIFSSDQTKVLQGFRALAEPDGPTLFYVMADKGRFGSFGHYEITGTVERGSTTYDGFPVTMPEAPLLVSPTEIIEIERRP
jgi:hypothetical protein